MTDSTQSHQPREIGRCTYNKPQLQDSQLDWHATERLEKYLSNPEFIASVAQEFNENVRKVPTRT